MHTEQGPQDRSYVANAHALACKVLQLCFRKLFGAQKGSHTSTPEEQNARVHL